VRCVEGQEERRRLCARPAQKLWTCHACGEGGDAVALEQALRGGTAREAAERLVGAAPPMPTRPAPPRPTQAEDDAASRAKRRLSERLWKEAAPAAGTPVQFYLAGRGLGGPMLDSALRRLRFHPAAYHSGREPDVLCAPGMIAQVVGPDGPTGGAHVTYLAEERGRWFKARLDPARRMWGPQAGAEGRFGGAALGGVSGPLVVAEGIENAIAAAMLLGVPCRPYAALSLNRLQGGWLPDKWGRKDPDAPAADPESPPYAWRVEPGSEVLIAVDRDMSPIKIKARKALGGTWERSLDAEARARVCASLALQHWRRLNPHLSANAVRAIAPGPGRDFNDELLARRR
jgi:hypothetical protein